MKNANFYLPDTFKCFSFNIYYNRHFKIDVSLNNFETIYQ